MKRHHSQAYKEISTKEVNSIEQTFVIPTTSAEVIRYEALKSNDVKRPEGAPSAMDILKKHHRI
ncbi:MAG: hypothetical protein PF694_02880 [Bacteroidetes bacterium]|jgi:hypothetical protein|nr:hypothetical protein [Bacteroidota bacterium]